MLVHQSLYRRGILYISAGRFGYRGFTFRLLYIPVRIDGFFYPVHELRLLIDGKVMYGHYIFQKTRPQGTRNTAYVIFLEYPADFRELSDNFLYGGVQIFFHNQPHSFLFRCRNYPQKIFLELNLLINLNINEYPKKCTLLAARSNMRSEEHTSEL